MTSSKPSLPSPSRRFAPRLATGLLAAAASLPCAASATEWHIADSQSAPAEVTGDRTPRQIAEAHLRGTSELRLDHVDWSFRGELRARSMRTERFDQSYEGLPVLNRSAAVRVAPDGAVRVVALDVERGLHLDPIARIDADEARGRVVARWGGARDVGRTTLAVLPQLGGHARLVWAIDRPNVRGGFRALVDAHDGSVLGRIAIGKTALGRVYEQSAVATPNPIDAELVSLDVSDPQTLTGWSGQLTVTNYVSGSSMTGNYVVEQTLQPSSGEDFLYDPPTDPTDETDAFAQVNLYYHLTRMRDYYTATHGLDMSGAAYRLVAVANVLENGAPYDNAFFGPMGPAAPFDAPNMIGVGQGAQFDFSDDSDVFLHEFTHFVNHVAVGYNENMFSADEWGLSTMPAAIDEGIADYMACTVNDDPELGEASLARLGAERNLTTGGKVCPDDVTGESHMDGEIIGNLTWSLRVALGTQTADDLVWGAVTLLTPGVTLGDFATALLQTADDFIAEGTLSSGDRATIEAAIAERGLDDCGHELAISEGAPRATFLYGLDIIAEYMGMTCADMAGFVELQSLFHYVTTPTPDSEGLRIHLTLDPVTAGDLDWAIYVRRNEHVGFGQGMFLPEVRDFDYVSERFSGTEGDLVIDASADPPFDPSSTYHFVVLHKNCATAAADVSVELLGGGGTGGSGGAGASGPTPPAAGDSGAAEDEGCGCRVGARAYNEGDTSRSRSGWLTLLVPLAFVVRRRRPT